MYPAIAQLGRVSHDPISRRVQTQCPGVFLSIFLPLFLSSFSHCRQMAERSYFGGAGARRSVKSAQTGRGRKERRLTTRRSIGGLFVSSLALVKRTRNTRSRPHYRINPRNKRDSNASASPRECKSRSHGEARKQCPRLSIRAPVEPKKARVSHDLINDVRRCIKYTVIVTRGRECSLSLSLSFLLPSLFFIAQVFIKSRQSGAPINGRRYFRAVERENKAKQRFRL